jgi:hypothetical protein
MTAHWYPPIWSKYLPWVRVVVIQPISFGPFTAGARFRRDAAAWTRELWRADGLPVVQAEPDPGATQWCKARAVGNGVRRMDGATEVFVIADADVFLLRSGTPALINAIDYVGRSGGWACPTSHVTRLNWMASEKINMTWSMPSRDELRGAAVEERHRQHTGGGLVVISAEAYAACPLDPRFAGWGHEDDSWSYALHTLIGPPLRGSAELYHLWHPPQARQSRSRGSDESWALFQRYHDARGDREKMSALMREFMDGVDSQ